jgi:hypothetical protein
LDGGLAGTSKKDLCEGVQMGVGAGVGADEGEAGGVNAVEGSEQASVAMKRASLDKGGESSKEVWQGS